MAVYDPVLVCNMALDRCGVGQHIDSLSDTSHLARSCNQWYAIARDRVLSAFQWPFTQTQTTLGLVEEEPNDEWAYSYRYPVACVVARRIVSGFKPESTPVAFELGQDATGRLIFTDQADAVLEMTASFDDPGEWPDALADAVSALLASEIARPLRVPSAKAQEALALYDRALLRAQGIANQERRLAPQPQSRYIRARGAFPTPDFPPTLRA